MDIHSYAEYNEKNCVFCFLGTRKRLDYENHDEEDVNLKYFCSECIGYVMENAGIFRGNRVMKTFIRTYDNIKITCTNCKCEKEDSFKLLCCKSHLPE